MAWNKLRTALLMPSSEQWHKWSIPSKVGFVGYAVTFLGTLFSVGWAIYTRPQTPPPTAYNLSDARRADFLDFLRVTPGMHVDKLRIGCVPSSEDSCMAAGEFAKLFSEAGWEIEGNQVFKVDTTLPVKGVSTVERDVDILALPRMPPDKGRWAAIDMSNVLIISAFRFMDNPVHGSSDPSLPDDTLGIYFGPDTDSFTSLTPAKKKLGEELVPFVKSGLAIEQSCLREPADACNAALAPWKSQVSSFLEGQNLSVDTTATWAKLSSQSAFASKDSIDKQLNFLIGLFFPTKQGTAPP